MSETVIVSLVGLFCSIVSSIVTFVLTRRKYSAEVDTVQIQNIESSFDLYKKMMEETFNNQNLKIERLQKENDNLRQQINSLQMQLVSIAGRFIGTENLPNSDKRPL